MHRVTLATIIIDQVDVVAADEYEAFWLAVQRAAEAKRIFQTTPIAIRAFVERWIDPQDPSKGKEWIEVDEKPLSWPL